MMIKRLRPIIGLILLAIALAAGTYYVSTHRDMIDRLAGISWTVSAAVFGLNIVMFGALLLILESSMHICGRKIKPLENFVINAHSLFINFFVPGQGGSAYRGVHLRQRHRLRIKNYLMVSLLYYLLYAVVSVFLLLMSSLAFWQTALAVAAVAGLGIVIVRWYSRRSKVGQRELRLGPGSVFLLLLATLFQAAIQISIYRTELHSVNQAITLSQIMTYTGAANLALFVAITPAAIGIRESFLIFTEHLHHISGANIIEANVIDRGVYIVFILMLLLVITGIHVINHLRLKHPPAGRAPGELGSGGREAKKSIF